MVLETIQHLHGVCRRDVACCVAMLCRLIALCASLFAHCLPLITSVAGCGMSSVYAPSGAVASSIVRGYLVLHGRSSA